MEICREHNIVFEGRECPNCLIEEDNNSLNAEIDKLNDEINSLQLDLDSSDNVIQEQEKEIEELNKIIVGLKSQLNKPVSGG